MHIEKGNVCKLYNGEIITITETFKIKVLYSTNNRYTKEGNIINYYGSPIEINLSTDASEKFLRLYTDNTLNKEIKFLEDFIKTRAHIKKSTSNIIENRYIIEVKDRYFKIIKNRNTSEISVTEVFKKVVTKTVFSDENI